MVYLLFALSLLFSTYLYIQLTKTNRRMEKIAEDGIMLCDTVEGIITSNKLLAKSIQIIAETVKLHLDEHNKRNNLN